MNDPYVLGVWDVANMKGKATVLIKVGHCPPLSGGRWSKQITSPGQVQKDDNSETE